MKLKRETLVILTLLAAGVCPGQISLTTEQVTALKQEAANKIDSNSQHK